ncbi:phosphate signaling complex protein PhoU [Faecalicoccus pleomorphus]|uniref:phosphate signaling complex protein PhoU n=1 Tax=Faecalicoccus pleomorphus TaxID=1323 RepID=UPI00242FB4A5|nr:phosphate signaling complex protein PhoU [Faecalicoccus pleomorphus]
MVIQTKFLKQLQQLELKMTEMGQSCLKGLSLCKHSLYDGDKVLTQEVDELHEEVSTLSRDCDQNCMRILLLQAPVAKDLRRITVSTNTVRDLTRIMDQEKEVASLIREMDHSANSEIHDSIAELFMVAKGMISNALNAYMSRDEQVAQDVIKMDDKADAAYLATKNFYTDKLAAKVDDPGNLVNLLLVGKYLERICDHAGNIARWVLYQKSGILESED